MTNVIELIEWNRVLLVRPYTDDICKYWRFKTPEDAIISSTRILFMYHSYKDKKDFVGMDMCRKFLETILPEKIC